ncbi:hydroxyethylthiazole kinase, partial [Thermococci archaeon]
HIKLYDWLYLLRPEDADKLAKVREVEL